LGDLIKESDTSPEQEELVDASIQMLKSHWRKLTKEDKSKYADGLKSLLDESMTCNFEKHSLPSC
jgi:hypothetical protein